MWAILWGNTRKALIKLLMDNADVFATSDDYLKYATTLMKMHIDTGDYKPILLKPYGIPIAHIKRLDEKINITAKSWNY